MKIFISGKITGLNYGEVVSKFTKAQRKLTDQGHDVVDPNGLNKGLHGGSWEHEDYMRITLAALSLCDAIYMLSDWKHSPGARMEHERAEALGLEIMYEATS